MAFPSTSNLFAAPFSALRLSDGGAGGPVEDVSSPLLRVI